MLLFKIQIIVRSRSSVSFSEVRLYGAVAHCIQNSLHGWLLLSLSRLPCCHHFHFWVLDSVMIYYTATINAKKIHTFLKENIDTTYFHYHHYFIQFVETQNQAKGNRKVELTVRNSPILSLKYWFMTNVCSKLHLTGSWQINFRLTTTRAHAMT